MSLEDDLKSIPEKPVPESQKTHIDVTSDGAEVKNAQFETASPAAQDWAQVFERFNLDPEEFEIVDDTVRMSSWDQSKRTESGDRDVVKLYSFSARFRRLGQGRLPDLEVQQRRERLQGMIVPPAIHFGGGTPVAAVVNLADLQGGKSEGGGVAATEQRLTDGLTNVQSWLARQREAYTVKELVLVNNGDPLEGCAGHYASQAFTVELNLRQQMNWVLDMWELYARSLFPTTPQAQFVSVLCNHGEFGRNGGKKNTTSDSDNAGGFLAETLRRTLEGDDRFSHVQWTIPHDEMTVYSDVNGVPMAFNHGHKINGNDASGFTRWLEGQVRGDERAYRARIWQTAHRHNFQAWDLGSCSAFQAPSLDGGSKWLRDSTGKYSQSGIIAYLVGDHAKLGWSDLAFL